MKTFLLLFFTLSAITSSAQLRWKLAGVDPGQLPDGYKYAVRVTSAKWMDGDYHLTIVYEHYGHESFNYDVELKDGKINFMRFEEESEPDYTIAGFTRVKYILYDIEQKEYKLRFDGKRQGELYRLPLQPIEEVWPPEPILEPIPEPLPDPIMDFPEKAAAWPGCSDGSFCTEEKMMKFINAHIRYPAICRDAGIQGRVYIQFEVNKKGEVVDVEVIKSADKNLDFEALRVVRKFPKFSPAESNGRKVRSRLRIPINFKLR